MDAVEDVKSRLSIEDVISRYVELKRAGRNLRGLSPFNSEKTPSFMVSPDKQIWHDFSSGKGGNMFSFVMEMEGVDFRGALELLARQAGIDLSQYQRSGNSQGPQKERLYQALELAAKFYQTHFKQNNQALEYILKKRKFSKQIALEFQIGYSPNTGNSLTKFLLSQKFTLDELKRAGLITQRFREPSDMFRGRIMIPLMDPFGRVIGFTARLLEDSPLAGGPKYINTPQTVLYDKSRHVFGLSQAKEAIRKLNYVIVTEGNLDVIASHQAGVRQTVATAGTAMTDQHFKQLGRLTQDVRLAFDQDKAGLAATERSIPLAAKADVTLSIITVKGAKDPDELIQKDPKLWQQAVEKPQYALDWLIERYKQQLDLSTAVGKRQFTDVILKVIRGLNDSVEQDHYVIELSKLIGVGADALRSKLTKTASGSQRTIPLKKVTPQQLDKDHQELVKNQNQFMAIMLMQPGLRMYLKEVTADMLPESGAKQLLELFNQAGKITAEDIINDEQQSQATRDFVQVMVLLYEEIYQGIELLDLRYEAAQSKARLIRQYVKTKKTELAQAMRDGGESPELLGQAKKLDELLNTIKEQVNG
ncbi:MAG: DNA primase [Candidatus Saccharimonadales bacterium]